jgi:hypothetical protein
MTNAAAKITYRNGFRAIKSLIRAAEDPRVAEIEGNGMDEGRVFISLVRGYRFTNWSDAPYDHTLSRSVGNAADVRDAMSMIISETPEVHQ